MKCTWVDCTAEAVAPQIGRNGTEWANLCSSHDKKVSDSVSGPAPEMISVWIKAQGGAKTAARRAVASALKCERCGGVVRTADEFQICGGTRIAICLKC